MINPNLGPFNELEPMTFENSAWIANFETVSSEHYQLSSDIFPAFDCIPKTSYSTVNAIYENNCENKFSQDKQISLQHSTVANVEDFNKTITVEGVVEFTSANNVGDSFKSLASEEVKSKDDGGQSEYSKTLVNIFSDECKSSVKETKQNNSNAESLLTLILEETSNLNIDFDNLLQNEFDDHTLISTQHLNQCNEDGYEHQQGYLPSSTSTDCLYPNSKTSIKINPHCLSYNSTNLHHLGTEDLESSSDDVSRRDWSNESLDIKNISRSHLLTDLDETNKSKSLSLHEIFTRTFNDQLTNINNTAHHSDSFGTEESGNNFLEQIDSEKEQGIENVLSGNETTSESQYESLFSSTSFDLSMDNSVLCHQTYSMDVSDVFSKSHKVAETFPDWSEVNSSFYDLGGFDYKNSKTDGTYDCFDLSNIDEEMNSLLTFGDESSINIDMHSTSEYFNSNADTMILGEEGQQINQTPKECNEYSNNPLAHVRKYHKVHTTPNQNEIISRDFQCTYPNCLKFYAKMSHLKAHLRRHSGERSFRCDWKDCKWKFSRSDELSRHKRSHFGIKPYPCTLCVKKFTRSDHLAKHLKVHERQKYKQMMKNIKKLKAK